MTTVALRRAIKATEETIGPAAYETQVLRRELDRRRALAARRRHHQAEAEVLDVLRRRQVAPRAAAPPGQASPLPRGRRQEAGPERPEGNPA